MTEGKKYRVLVAPLDWGLGHASRCVPLIHTLMKQGFEVVLAADHAPLAFLRKSFPKLEYHQLPGLKITYSKKLPSALSIALQSPAFLVSIRQEQKNLEHLLSKIRIDAIISDNRYGVHHPKIPSILLTHQLNLQLPVGAGLANALLGKYIRKFSAIWVPDFPSLEQNLSGSLSHSAEANEKLRFIGPLSQFGQDSVAAVPIIRKLLVLLSGPEPNRTQLENRVLEQLEGVEFEVLIIRGLPLKHEENLSDNPKIKVLNFLKGHELQTELMRSEVVLCRSGYSSVMDLFTLKKKAVLVPTPGQYEQEYLAKHLFENRLFYTVKENALSLPNEVERAIEFKGFQADRGSSLLEKQIRCLADLLNREKCV